MTIESGGAVGGHYLNPGALSVTTPEKGFIGTLTSSPSVLIQVS